MMAGGKHSIRAVTHLMIGASDIDQTIAAMEAGAERHPHQNARRFYPVHEPRSGGRH